MYDPRDLTTGEAEAWRAGWRAACADAAALCDAGAQQYADQGHSDTYVLLWEHVAEIIRAMRPPAAITNPPGRASEG